MGHLSNLEDSISRLWSENLQLKLNLSKWNAVNLNDTVNLIPTHVGKMNQLRHIQRRIRIQKLNSMRLPKLFIKTTKNLPRKINDNCSALAQEAAEIIENLGTNSQPELTDGETGQLRSRIYLKRKQEENKNEYTIKKLMLASESTIYSRLLF